MRTASLRLADIDKTILNIGFVGENEHVRIRFDASRMYEQYPDAVVSLSVCPPEGDAYPAVIERDGDFVIWDIVDSNVNHEGRGEYQLSFTEGEVVAKTYVGKFCVGRSVVPTGNVPEGIDDFITRAGAALEAIPETISTEVAEAVPAAVQTALAEDEQILTGLKDAAAASASDSEAWAVGKRGGQDVGSSDPAYQNNSKYYKEQTEAAAAGQIQSITDEGTRQIGLVQGEGTTQIGLVEGEGTTQKAAVQLKGEQTLASIPSDYTTLSNDVTSLKSQITYKADKVYGGATSNNSVDLTPCKAWHSTLGTMVNGSNRASGGPIEVTPDMKSISVSNGYTMLLYGNNEGLGNALSTISSWSTSAVNIVGNITYKYIFPMIAKTTQTDFSPSDDLSGVVNIAVYGTELKFALDDDLKKTDAKTENNKEDLFETEKTIGVIHLNLHKDNIINDAVYSATGLPTGGYNSTRACNNELIPIEPNVPIYFNIKSGYSIPHIFYFKNGTYQGYDSSFASGKSYDADSARFLFFKNPSTSDITPQNVEDNYTLWQEASNSYNNRIKALEDAPTPTPVSANDYSLIAYGDSLTTGAGATDTNHTYWGVCASVLNMKNRIGFGYGGSQSRPIAFTAGALTGYVPPSTRSFALKFADLTTNISINANVLNGKTVIIEGQEYTIGQTGATAYTLPDGYTPKSYWVPATVKNSRYTADVYIIWVGTNDGGMQWDIVDAMIAKLPHKRYVVIGLTRLGTDTSIEDEKKGYEKYGSHYLNIRMQIISSAFAIIGKTPTAEDTTAMNAGLMPPSLMSDATHFNDDGYEAIGKILAKHIQSLGYSYQVAT